MPNWSIVSLCVLLGVVVRWGVSLNSYSGRFVWWSALEPGGWITTVTSGSPSVMLAFSTVSTSFAKNTQKGTRARVGARVRACARERETLTGFFKKTVCFVQELASRPCLVIMKPRDTGKRWPTTPQFRNGAYGCIGLKSFRLLCPSNARELNTKSQLLTEALNMWGKLDWWRNSQGFGWLS